MTSNKYDEIINECEELGIARVEAELSSSTSHLYHYKTIAQGWLLERKQQIAENRHKEILRPTLWAVFASWAIAAITLLSVFWQIHDSSEQRNQMSEQIKQQRKDSEDQREDAKPLLEVQILLELDKRFDSPEMRNARKRTASQLLHSNETNYSRVIDFFDTLAMYAHQRRIDQDSAYQSYSYYIERYWLIMKPSIEKFRKLENDPTYYQDFEELYNEILLDDVNHLHKTIIELTANKKELHRFLEEEASLQ